MKFKISLWRAAVESGSEIERQARRLGAGEIWADGSGWTSAPNETSQDICLKRLSR